MLSLYDGGAQAGEASAEQWLSSEIARPRSFVETVSLSSGMAPLRHGGSLYSVDELGVVGSVVDILVEEVVGRSLISGSSASVAEEFAVPSFSTDDCVTSELSVLLRTGMNLFLSAGFRCCEARLSDLPYSMGKLDDLTDSSTAFSPEDDAASSISGGGSGPIGADHILLRLWCSSGLTGCVRYSLESNEELLVLFCFSHSQ